MLLTEYNEAKTMELLREEGRVMGRSEGVNLISALIAKLIDLGRNDDVARIARDSAYRDKLLAEFQMI